MNSFIPRIPNFADWYWYLDGEQNEQGQAPRYYSSRAGAFVPASEGGLVVWLDLGNHPTRIASLEELANVLSEKGIPATVPQE